MTTLPALILSCRTLAGDGSTDNFVRGENCNNPENGNALDGLNMTFSVANFPVVPGGFQVIRVDNTVVTPTSVTEALGIFTVPTAPQASVYATYYYYLFPDTVWTEFVVAGLEQCNISTGTPILDTTTVPEGLLVVVKQYISYYFCQRMSMQTGLWYNQRLQERTEDRDNISRKWLALSQATLKAADAMLASYYAGSGTQDAPAFQIGGWQPRPWSPYR
jgi:hypothetical protein